MVRETAAEERRWKRPKRLSRRKRLLAPISRATVPAWLASAGNGNGGGTFGGQPNGGGSKWGAFAGQVQSKVASALRSNSQTKKANLKIQVRIWSDTTGRITRAKLDASTGDSKLDQVIQTKSSPTSNSTNLRPQECRCRSSCASPPAGPSCAFTDFMLQEKYVFRRCVWLLVTAWCTAVPIPGIAGRPATPEEERRANGRPRPARQRRLPCLHPPPVNSLPMTCSLTPTYLLARADAAREPITASASPSQNVTVNLINRLVERGVLTNRTPKT